MLTSEVERKAVYDDGIPVKGVIVKTASIEIQGPIFTVFDYITAEDALPKILKKFGPIHAVTGATIVKGPWKQAGAARILHFESGDTLKEQLLAFDRPTYFSYSISEFSNFAKHITRIAYGQWWFTEDGNRTLINWKYSFVPKSALTRPLVSFFMNRYYQKYMEQCLSLIKQHVETGH